MRYFLHKIKTILNTQMEKNMLVNQQSKESKPSLHTLAKRTKLSVTAVKKVLEEYSVDLNLNRIPSSHEPIPDRLAENLYKILNYHKLGWSHNEVLSVVNGKPSSEDQKINRTNPIVAVIKGQARLQKKISLGMQIAENLQGRLQSLERHHKIDNHLLETKLDMLIDVIENLKKENKVLKVQLDEKTSGAYLVHQVKKWIQNLF